MTDTSETRYLIFVDIPSVKGDSFRRCGLCHAAIPTKRETDHALWHIPDFDKMHDSAGSLEADASIAVIKYTKNGKTIWGGHPVRTELQKRVDEGWPGYPIRSPKGSLVRKLWRKWWHVIDPIGAILLAAVTGIVALLVISLGDGSWSECMAVWLGFNILIHFCALSESWGKSG